ncbi:MAG: acetyl-CoA C-acyltransferase, partial [Desulfuromonadales bacterium]|nr:acetyl-CoA C-acyltransferase [Desulfuromonadales bacterium]NIS43199.1 acetyl-CoA C-acyltransferase [Desulfuromonadales bacterium]
LQLSTHAVNGLVGKFVNTPDNIDGLVWGRVLHDPRISNLAREVVFDTGLPKDIHALMVSNNCITSLHAMVDVADGIRSGRMSLGIAGGVESMSTVPILFGREASAIFLEAGMAKTAGDRLKAMSKLRFRHFKPKPLSFKEPSTGLTMGQHAEVTVQEWGIGQADQDRIAYNSHINAAGATEDGRLKEEIHPLDGIDHDTIVRGDTTLDKLASLKPVFDRSEKGTITAGNSSPLTDGAASILLASEEALAANNLEAAAWIRDVEFAAIDPADGLLMAPALAVPRLLRRTGLTLDDMDIVEIHEAFGAQVATNLAAWEKGWKEEPIGTVPMEKINPL